jgi:hypothetical protein
MSNQSNRPEDNVANVRVVGINEDVMGEEEEVWVKVDIGAQVSISKRERPTMNAFPQSYTPHLRPYLSIFFPDSEWNNQYYVGQRFEFIVKDKGELSLKPVDKT